LWNMHIYILKAKTRHEIPLQIKMDDQYFY
jgi:hypothetical protein